MQRAQFPKMILFYTLQHFGILRELQEALESHIACSNTKKAYRRRTVVFLAKADAGCLVCSSEALQTHQAISLGQRFRISLSNVQKNSDIWLKKENKKPHLKFLGTAKRFNQLLALLKFGQMHKFF